MKQPWRNECCVVDWPEGKQAHSLALPHGLTVRIPGGDSLLVRAR